MIVKTLVTAIIICSGMVYAQRFIEDESSGSYLALTQDVAHGYSLMMADNSDHALNLDLRDFPLVRNVPDRVSMFILAAEPRSIQLLREFKLQVELKSAIQVDNCRLLNISAIAIIPYDPVADRPTQRKIYLLPEADHIIGVPVFTASEELIPRFVISDGYCPSDKVRTQRLLQQEVAEHFANGVKAIVFGAQLSFLQEARQLNIVQGSFRPASFRSHQDTSSFYILYELESLFDRTRSRLDQIDENRGAAMRGSIDSTIPDHATLVRGESKTTPGLVPKETGDRLIEAVKTLFVNLITATSDITLDLSVFAFPSPANVYLETANHNIALSGTTSAPIRNIYRGTYKITIERYGYKLVIDTKDFLSQPGDTLDCHELIPVSAAKPVNNCDLK